MRANANKTTLNGHTSPLSVVKLVDALKPQMAKNINNVLI